MYCSLLRRTLGFQVIFVLMDVLAKKEVESDHFLLSKESKKFRPMSLSFRHPMNFSGAAIFAIVRVGSRCISSFCHSYIVLKFHLLLF